MGYGCVPQLALSPKVGQAVQLESSKCNTSAVFPRVKRINTTIQQHKCRKLFKSFPQRFIVMILFPHAFDQPCHLLIELFLFQAMF